MELQLKTLRKAINKAFLKEVVDRPSFNRFKDALSRLLDNIEAAEQKEEHEEHFKNFLVPFFNEIGLEEHYINTSGRIDLAIHNGPKVQDPVGVLIEVKRPSNQAEMITAGQPDRKAMHEAVLYYLEQRMEEENSDLKHVIITNMQEWFVFDAQEFERCFYRPSTLRKAYKSWKANQKVSSNRDFMYGEISKVIGEQETTLYGSHFSLVEEAHYLKAKEESDHEKKLIPLYKFFTPVHLLKEPFANDSNTLNKKFYRELLYILGLEEVREGSTRYIGRAGEQHRQPGSLIENTIRILESEDHLSTVSEPEITYGSDPGEQLFNVALDLCITWMNRILFLKLLEAQLFRYHRQDSRFKFLDIKTIDEYDELNKLFFQVLAKREEERPEGVNEKFGHIPYLNSSLFDVSTLEHETTRISGLDDKAEMPVHSGSVLSDLQGSTLSTLEYLFRFLEAYDFSAEKGEEIQKERKTLINASVLGLIFEKINGYKDGSFYTPGFITEYMARETLRKAMMDRFEEVLGARPGAQPESPSPQTPLPRGEGLRGMSAEVPKSKLPDSVLENARNLRKKQTEAEELLWKLLRNRQLGAKFRRQHPIKEGFILDFYTHQAKLAIELDGGYHEEEPQKRSDEERDQLLEEMGIQVLRFKNKEIFDDTENVLQTILTQLQKDPTKATSNQSKPLNTSTPVPPSPAGRGAGGEGGLSLTHIYNAIGREISIDEANALINSITICDPAVGSGHFLVSCLNELLAIKSELGILCDTEGRRLREVKVAVENDELIVSWGDEELFEYDVAHTWQGQTLKQRNVNPEVQRVQKALFHEKRYLIENCLFGVDINPNSVKICRLRLWIELLKNAYYTLTPNPSPTGRGASVGSLEVLPNIDINIKQGNSLVSRFGLESDLGSVFNDSDHSLEEYREAVRSYRQTGDRAEKHRLQELIDEIKREYSTTLLNNRPINKTLSKARGNLELMQNADLFGEQKFSKKEIKQQQQKVRELEEQKAQQESGAFYNQAFEWRFEFPEVLDDEGRFTGFDVVIANPPYGVKLNKEEKEYLKQKFKVTKGNYDVYTAFIEIGSKIGKTSSYSCYIAPVSWLTGAHFKWLRKYLKNELKLEQAIILPYDVFPDAYIDTGIYLFNNDRKENYNSKVFEFHPREKIGQDDIKNINFKFLPSHYWENETGFEIIFKPSFYELKNKVFQNTEILDEISESTRGILAKSSDIFEEKREDLKPLFVGNLYRYTLEPEFLWVKYGDNLKEKPSEYYYFKGKRILIRRLISRQFRMMASLVEQEFINKKDIYNLLIKDNKYFQEYILALINSKLFSYLKVGGSSLATKDDFSQLTLRDLRQLPIKIIGKKEQRKFVDLVDQILTAKRDNPEADTTGLEAEIDRRVYELYGLSEEEIGIVEESVG